MGSLNNTCRFLTVLEAEVQDQGTGQLGAWFLDTTVLLLCPQLVERNSSGPFYGGTNDTVTSQSATSNTINLGLGFQHLNCRGQRHLV